MKFIYNNAFIFLSLINVILLFIIDYSYISLLIYLNSISLNYILYKDFKFEIKNKYSNINFIFLPNYYPSNRTFNKYIMLTNVSIIYSLLVILSIDFWLNQYKGIKNESYIYIFTLMLFSFITTLLVITKAILLTYSIYNIGSKLINYINKIPLKEHDLEYYCWVCEKRLSKYKTLKKLNCPCQELFHPECIDNYLGLYNNYCRNGHRIAKFEHTV